MSRIGVMHARREACCPAAAEIDLAAMILPKFRCIFLGAPRRGERACYEIFFIDFTFFRAVEIPCFVSEWPQRTGFNGPRHNN